MARVPPNAAERLANWASVGERDAPVAFVGRDREIDLALRQLATWQSGASRGRTVIAQGAPGAGKTALLREIGQRLPTVLPNAVSIYLPTPWLDEDVPHLLAELAARMMGASPDILRTTKESKTAGGVRALATATHAESRSVSPPRLHTWTAFERMFAPMANQAKPTLLLVDEVQRFGSGEAAKNLLFHLHDQTTFPLVLACGGLSTSAGRLGEVGLSRPTETNVLHIDALTLDEAQRSLEESLGVMAEDVGGIAGHPDQWARKLAVPTQGWPQHVTVHFRAAPEALIESDRLAFDDANLLTALARAEDSMRRYYERRLEASRTDAMVVFALHETIARRDVRRLDAFAVVDAVRPLLGRYGEQDHDRNFPHPADCVDQMLYAGVVAYASSATTSPLSVPIPSMAAHIAHRLTAEQRTSIRRALGLQPAP